MNRLRPAVCSAIFESMHVVEQAALWLVALAVGDWLVAGRLAALVPSVNYQYWPPSKLRLITSLMLGSALAADAYYPAEWTLLTTLLALIVYGAAILADVEAQRGRGDAMRDAPARYSDRDANY